MMLFRLIALAIWLVGSAAGGSKAYQTLTSLTYLVEFAQGQDADDFYRQLASQGISASPRLNMTFALFEGCSFDLNEVVPGSSKLAASLIAKMPMVKKLWPITSQTMEQFTNPSNHVQKTAELKRGIYTRQSTNDTWSSHVMTQVDRVRAQGITGKGVKIGIVDSGVDFNHPALGGCFGPGCLISYGYDFIDNKPQPYDNCNGHGTHVAGIIAAQSNNSYGLTGVAPGATLGMYRVAGCDNKVAPDTAILGMNKAYEDGSDIITISAGFGAHWSENPVSVVMQRIVERGIICVAANGNRGIQKLFPTEEGGPASGKGVASIGSVINNVVPQNLTTASYTVDSANSSSSREFVWNAGDLFSDTTWLGTFPLYATSRESNSTSDACQSLPSDTPNLQNYIALVRLSGLDSCTVGTQVDILKGKGAKRIMFYGPDELASQRVPSANPSGIAGVTLQSQGVEWLGLLNSGHQVFLHMVDPTTASRKLIFSPNPLTGGYVSGSSSWGPSPELDIEPKFTAPGANIFSTWPLDLGGYSTQSGTSMATPFAAGVYALLVEARKIKDPATLQRILSSTAKPNLDNSAGSTPNILAPVAQQGAGLLQAFDAARTTTLLSVGSIAFNDTDHFAGKVIFTLTNTGSSTVTYSIGHTKAATVYTFVDEVLNSNTGPYPPANAWASLSFSQRSIAVLAGKSVNISVTAVPPTGLNATRLPVYSGYITLNGTNGDNLSIPYLGVAGSMYSTPIWGPSIPGFPSNTRVYLEDDWRTSFPPGVPPNTTFTVPVPTSPTGINDTSMAIIPGVHADTTLASAIRHYLLVPLAINGTLNTTDILGYQSAGDIHDPYPFPIETPKFWWDGRLQTDLPFTGMLADGTIVPEGQYEIRSLALRVFGDPNKAADYDSLGLPFYLRYEQNATSKNVVRS